MSARSSRSTASGAFSASRASRTRWLRPIDTVTPPRDTSSGPSTLIRTGASLGTARAATSFVPASATRAFRVLSSVASRPRAPAIARTEVARGRRLRPCSMSLSTAVLSPALSASSRWVRPRRLRRSRRNSPRGVVLAVARPEVATWSFCQRPAATTGKVRESHRPTSLLASPWWLLDGSGRSR